MTFLYLLQKYLDLVHSLENNSFKNLEYRFSSSAAQHGVSVTFHAFLTI